MRWSTAARWQGGGDDNVRRFRAEADEQRTAQGHANRGEIRRSTGESWWLNRSRNRAGLTWRQKPGSGNLICSMSGLAWGGASLVQTAKAKPARAGHALLASGREEPGYKAEARC